MRGAVARRHLPETTPVGVVRNAYRKGESGDHDACEFDNHFAFVDMHSIVVIGGEGPGSEDELVRENHHAPGIPPKAYTTSRRSRRRHTR